jgi:hypothetical protein
LRILKAAQTIATNLSDMRGHVSIGTKAAMTRQSLDLLRQRYVIEKKPLEASVERILRADTRAGARAVLALIDKRRSENRSEGQPSARCFASRRLFGVAGAMPWQVWTRPV